MQCTTSACAESVHSEYLYSIPDPFQKIHGIPFAAPQHLLYAHLVIILAEGRSQGDGEADVHAMSVVTIAIATTVLCINTLNFIIILWLFDMTVYVCVVCLYIPIYLHCCNLTCLGEFQGKNELARGTPTSGLQI